MNPSNTTGGRPASQPPVGKNIAAAKTPSQPEPTASEVHAVVSGVRLVARGGSRYDRIMVRRCCFCGYPHWHIGFEHGAQSIQRAPACSRSRLYTVRITSELPTAAERDEQRAHLQRLLDELGTPAPRAGDAA